MNTNETMVFFRIGRGGKSYKPGHVFFFGEGNIKRLEEYISDRMFERDGKFYDCSGNEVGEVGGGRYDFDGDYQTYYATPYDQLTEEEIEAVRRIKSGPKSERLLKIIEG